MKNKNEIKKFAKLLNEFMDKEIKASKLMYEADETEDLGLTARKNQWASLLGKDITHDPGTVQSSIRTGEYGKVEIPPQFDMFRKEAIGLEPINHAILSRVVDRSFFITQKQVEPSPLLIWGAPGIGKSEGVKEGAKKIAMKLAKQKNLTFVDKPSSMEEAFSNKEVFDESFYFIDWNRTSAKDKNLIMSGPSVQENDLVNKGETVTVSQYELRVPAKNLFIFFDVRVAGAEATDILGIPFRADAHVRYKITKVEEPRIVMQRLPFLKVCCEEKDLSGIIMWDEINQGSPQTQSALYSVILDRVVGDNELAPNIGQFAASNGSLWNTAPLMPALAARFQSNYLWLSPEDWLIHHKKELPPIVYDFIANNPKVSFYITEEGWDKHYVGKAAQEGQTKEDFVKSSVKWPNPRDLSKFAKQSKGLIDMAGEEGWDIEKLKNEMVELATRTVGPVWAEHFGEYFYSESTIKWEQLVSQPQAIKGLVTGTKDIEPVRNLMVKHFRKAFDLSKTVHTKEKYMREARDVMTVLVHVADVQLDSIGTILAKVREDATADKTGESPEQIGSRMAKVIADGKAGLPDKLKAGADKVMVALKNMLAETPVLGKGAPQKLATNTIAQPTATPTAQPPAAATTIPTGSENSIPEKYTRFRKIFEEISSTLNKQPVADEAPEASDGSIQKQRSSMQSIGKQINMFVSKMTEESDKEILGFINRQIMADTILSKEQKQKLISVIKDAPTSIDAMQIISAYTTGNIFKLA